MIKKSVLAKIFVVLFIAATAVLEYYGILPDIKKVLDSHPLVLEVGEFRLSAYVVLKGMVTVIALFWIASSFSDFVTGRVKRLHGIRSSNKALLNKALQAFIYFIAFVSTLDVLGIDLKALTIFSGAVGIGVGFGLQKITSNFMSGLIILFEKSIEDDDLIELADGTLGFVKQTSARFTLLETYDKREVMVPNEELITSKVTNWTFSSKAGRVEIRFGVSYKSDIHLVRDLALEAAKDHPRNSSITEPQCFLTEFGDSSVNFVLFMFVDDVVSGLHPPKSEVMYALWDKFKEHKIEIPFPQLDLHMKR